RHASRPQRRAAGLRHDGRRRPRREAARVGAPGRHHRRGAPDSVQHLWHCHRRRHQGRWLRARHVQGDQGGGGRHTGAAQHLQDPPGRRAPDPGPVGASASDRGQGDSGWGGRGGRERAEGDTDHKLFVGGLPSDISEEEL
ncbi:unnamed protein product, partial [Prorocentrum cordatum]